MAETVKKSPEITWGLPKQTILIDSQSAPVLSGIEAEQRYFRLYLMGRAKDIAVINYSINGAYLNYLTGVLKLEMPRFLHIPHVGAPTLSENILGQKHIVSYLQRLTGTEGYKMQFFGLYDGEVALARQLSNPTYSGDLEATSHLGTKAGFREFCMQNNIPMPQGAICDSPEEVTKAIQEIDGDVIIKASRGTGGKELGSNATIAKVDFGRDAAVVNTAIETLSPNKPPYVVEKKLKLPEASLHIFIDESGEVIFEPMIFGQLAHDGSYVGGHYPNNHGHFPITLSDKVIALAKDKIIPALKGIKATGFHCMDFLYDVDQEGIFFIEDNTRPGALDFIHHFVTRVVEKNVGQKPYAWYHQVIPLNEIGIDGQTTFEEVYEAIKDYLDPNSGWSKQLGAFGLVSNPDVLPYGYALHLTAVVYGDGKSYEDAQRAHHFLIQKLKEHFGKA